MYHIKKIFKCKNLRKNMAKRKKVVRAKTKVKTKVKAKVVKAKAVSTIQSAYLLTITGAIITLVAGVLAALFVATLTFFLGGVGALASLPNIICGIVMLITTRTLRKNPRTSSIVLLVFSIIALITPPFGFIVGPILTLIASILILVKV